MLTSVGGRLGSVQEGAQEGGGPPPPSPAGVGMGSSVEGTPEQVNGVAEEEQEEEQEEDSDEEEEEEDEEEGEEEDDDDSAEYETDSGSGSEYETDSDDEEEDESGDGGGGGGAGAVTLPVSPGGTVGSKSVCTDLLLLHSLYFSLLLTCLVCVRVWVWVYLTYDACRQGWVWKESDHLRSWRRRWLSCKAGRLTYSKTPPKSGGGGAVSSTDEAAAAAGLTVISLKHAHVGPPKTMRARPYCFRVTVSQKAAERQNVQAAAKYVLAVDTAAEKMEWLTVLRENIAVASGKAVPKASSSSSSRCAALCHHLRRCCMLMAQQRCAARSAVVLLPWQSAISV
jgi:hypothetical protein